jgi:hypothetical protein
MGGTATTKTFTEANSLQWTQTATPLFSLRVVKNLHICKGLHRM